VAVTNKKRGRLKRLPTLGSAAKAASPAGALSSDQCRKLRYTRQHSHEPQSVPWAHHVACSCREPAEPEPCTRVFDCSRLRAPALRHRALSCCLPRLLTWSSAFCLSQSPGAYAQRPRPMSPYPEGPPAGYGYGYGQPPASPNTTFLPAVQEVRCWGCARTHTFHHSNPYNRLCQSMSTFPDMCRAGRKYLPR